MKTLIIRKLSLALLTTATLFSAANATEGEWEWSGVIAKASYSEDVMWQGIEDSSNSYSFYGSYDHGRWLTSIGAEYLDYDDFVSFTQDTTEGMMESDASGTLINVAFGPKWQLG